MLRGNCRHGGEPGAGRLLERRIVELGCFVEQQRLCFEQRLGLEFVEQQQ